MRLRIEGGLQLGMLVLAALTVTNGAAAQSVREGGRCRVAGGGADLSQATLMLEFLTALAEGRQPWRTIDRILESPGTDLVIQQMNLARRVSASQYRTMLRALVAGVDPEIAPVDSTSRARRGVSGLEDAFNALLWATGRTEKLRERLRTLQGLAIDEYACAEAFGNLPRPVDLEISVSVVMGGRAGAAALNGGRIYADVIIMDRAAARRGLPHFSDEGLLDFFAHEIHHLALEKIIEETWADLTFSDPEDYVSHVLAGLVLEGSATYLIDFDSDLRPHLTDPGFRTEFADITSLLSRVEVIIQRILAEQVSTEAEYEEVTAGIVGNRYHAAGAFMLAAVDRTNGRDAVMEVMRDPRRLLSEYLVAVSSESGGTSYLPDGALAARVASMGSDPRTK